VSEPDRDLDHTFGAGEYISGSFSVGIRNLRQVTPWLYRGGQPDSDGLKTLNELGVRTVVSLRWSKNVVEAERKAVISHGMSFESIPLHYWAFPSEGKIRHFLSIVDDEQRRPVFVHCLHGSDRTGLLLAMYRMARDGWDADRAYQEMKNCGFHLFRMYHFKWAVYAFARKLKSGRGC